MAIGDVVADISLKGAGSTENLLPGSGVEWIIHNIYHEAGVELRFCEYGKELLFDVASVKGSWSGYYFHLTNLRYMTVKNIEGTSKLIGYDGIVTKEV